MRQIRRNGCSRLCAHFDRLAACVDAVRVNADTVRLPDDSECYAKIAREALAVKVVREKKKLRTDCTHLGIHVNEHRCETCAGEVWLKIFSCRLHGLCCIGKAPNGVRSCAKCGDYRPAPIIASTTSTTTGPTMPKIISRHPQPASEHPAFCRLMVRQAECNRSASRHRR